jgi:putative SOS response-associated peptidase YedK
LVKHKPKVAHQRAAETVHKLPLFREAFAKRRCLTPPPASTSGKREAAVAVRAEGPRAVRLCRIWEFARLERVETLFAAIIVGEPNPLVAGVHDRMPVIVLPDQYDASMERGPAKR